MKVTASQYAGADVANSHRLTRLGALCATYQSLIKGETAVMDDVEVRRDHVPGAIGGVIERHGAYHHAHSGGGSFFEVNVARELADFI
jgi:hypothetical protein